MKAWAKTLGTVAALGTVAPLALVAAWYALDGAVAPTEDAGTQRHGLAGQHLAVNDGLDLVRALSSTRSTRAAGPMMVPAASGQLTLAAFDGNPLLEPTRIVMVETGASAAPLLLAAADDGARGNSGFVVFADNAGGSSRAIAASARGSSLAGLMGAAGTISGPSGGGSALQPDTMQILQASGSLGEPGVGPASGGSGIPGYNFNLTVAPLPPAILAFLSGLAALFAVRRARGRAGEPAVG